VSNPFDLDDPRPTAAWREQKLDSAPRRIEDILVALDDPRALTAGERDAHCWKRCATANMAIYTSNTVGDADKEIPRGLGRQLGLAHLDSHWLTDDDAISPISVRGAEERGERREFIPYTDKPIRWHTDGYYNLPERTVRGMILHCVQSAATGGENQLLDHEIAYILLRDENPDHIRALSRAGCHDHPGAPGREPASPAPPSRAGVLGRCAGFLHMRYTARTISIEWRAMRRRRPPSRRWRACWRRRRRGPCTGAWSRAWAWPATTCCTTVPASPRRPKTAACSTARAITSGLRKLRCGPRLNRPV
jgi:hypothetical protein